jgi:anhydro-N-acetylmuramic acid kinase
MVHWSIFGLVTLHTFGAVEGKERMRKDQTITAIGTMSGTSLDGVDAAVLVTDGHRILEFGDTGYRPYDDDERAELRAALGKWPGDDGVREAAFIVEDAHAEVLAGFEPADLIGFHGQTLAHDPRGRGTHQAGDGAALAQALDRTVIWDFRSNDVAFGGEGAPLAPAYHFALAKWMNAAEPLVFLNLGGVGNVTYVDPAFDTPEQDGALLAFDTGPANAPVNDLMQSRFGKSYDKDGALASKGTVDADLLDQFSEHRYFMKMPPKSLDRDAFAASVSHVSSLNDADAAATLTAMAAVGVAQSEALFPRPPTRILATGGGRHNPVLMAMVAAGVTCPVQPVEDVGLDGDMLEAQAFAFLAARVLNGLPTSFPSTTGVRAAIGGGEISRPGDTK